MIHFYLNENKQLSCVLDEQNYEDIKLAHQFPLRCQLGENISIYTTLNEEIGTIISVHDLPNAQQSMVFDYFNQFLNFKEINKIYSISSEKFPTTIHVKFDTEERKILIQNKEDFLVIGFTQVLMRDDLAQWYVIRDITNLDAKSKNLLSPFVFQI
jgi:hypothetical protein